MAKLYLVTSNEIMLLTHLNPNYNWFSQFVAASGTQYRLVSISGLDCIAAGEGGLTVQRPLLLKTDLCGRVMVALW